MSSDPPPVKLESELGNDGGDDVKPALDELFHTGSPPPPRPPTPPLLDTPSPTKEETRENGHDVKPKGNGGGGKRGKKVEELKPVLIDQLSTAWDEAHETFEALERCVYERKDMGLSREQDEMMVCDCVFDKHDAHAQPCGLNSDCINRALFIECLADECRAKGQCRNQQFTKRQYGPVEIVLTEMKGYGLRAADDMPAGTLIYEYIGEVIQEKTFRKRMQQYAEEGIRHFYFMMLQKEEYIDATKKGGIGRFANHSCNPNSEVQKWVVGRRLRMGIFTKRDVIKGEEITFNYNVDRYGHDAQTCYCGEPNCVGTIGGKTQTDVGTMNDLFLDALGITDEVEEMQMKGSKKKKSRQLDEDFVPVLHPIEDHEVQKVAAAMRQSMENKRMMSRLLERIHMTDEGAVHRQLMRMHGFSLMSMILIDMADDRDIVLLALESMSKWKLSIRNKIEDSNIEEPVKALTNSADDQISALARQLLEYWSGLELSYRIPRVSKIANLDAEDEAATTTIAEANTLSYASHRRPDAWENAPSIQVDFAPVRPRPPPPAFARSRPPPPPPPPARATSQSTSFSDKSKLDAIIAMAQQSVAAAAAVAAVAESPKAESSRSGSARVEEAAELDQARRKRVKRSHERGPEDEARRERRLTKMVGEVVVRAMSKYKEQMDHETFKKYARECTHVLVEKEKKGHSYAAERHPTLSDDKKAKMKAFTKEYTHKVLKKLKEKGKLKKPSSSALGATPTTTPRGPASGTGSSLLDTPTPGSGSGGGGGGARERAELDDIFGADDDAEEEDGMEVETGPSPPDVTTPLDDTPLRVGGRGGGGSPLDEIKKGRVLERKLNGGIRVESLDMRDLNGIKATPTRTPDSAEGG